MNTIQKLFVRRMFALPRTVLNIVHPLTSALRSATPPPPPEQLSLNLDRMTDTGLRLREAMAVRSAEFWLALGEPRLALREFETLTDLARQNAWAARVHVHAASASQTLAA